MNMDIHLKKDKQGKANVVNAVSKGYSCFGGRLLEFVIYQSGADLKSVLLGPRRRRVLSGIFHAQI